MNYWQKSSNVTLIAIAIAFRWTRCAAAGRNGIIIKVSQNFFIKSNYRPRHRRENEMKKETTFHFIAQFSVASTAGFRARDRALFLFLIPFLKNCRVDCHSS